MDAITDPLTFETVRRHLHDCQLLLVRFDNGMRPSAYHGRRAQTDDELRFGKRGQTWFVCGESELPYDCDVYMRDDTGVWHRFDSMTALREWRPILAMHVR